MTNQNSNGKKRIPPSSNAESGPNARHFHQRGSNGRGRIPVQDHPQWRGTLDSRHILKSAFAAGAWVEREDWSGQDVLVWRTRQRDGSLGATRRRLLKPASVKGIKQAKVRWQYADQKTDEPFYYVGTLDGLKREIARAGGKVYIVEGEFDVWSLRRLGILNVIGIYGIHNIPKDIGGIFVALGVISFIYLADNDRAGETGASNLRTLLHESVWAGAGEYRRVEGPGIPEKGDSNDLLCRHYPDMAAARAALDALPPFEPNLKRKQTSKPAAPADGNREGWDAVHEAIRIALGVDRFKPNGWSKNFRCRNPEHEHDDKPSAGWHRDGIYKCFYCGQIKNTQVAKWLHIDWRALRWPRPQIADSKAIDLNAAPQAPAETAPLAFEQAPDSWLRLLRKFYKPIEPVLFLYVLRAQLAGLLAKEFTRQELLKALPAVGCKVDPGAIYKVFQEAGEHNNHPLFVKIDPGRGSGSRYCKFGLRPLEDIRRRLIHDIRLRVYEKKFPKHHNTLIAFEVFDEALPGSKFTKTLKAALEPLYRQQKKRLASLVNSCEGIIAGYIADLDDLSATPLPDWTIDKPSELPALLARGIYDEEPEDRGKAKWAPELGIGKTSVDTALQRAGIKRTPYTIMVEVSSHREARNVAREHGAKIIGIKVGGIYFNYDEDMDIPPGSIAVLQPPAKHETVSDEKQIVKAPAKSSPNTAADSETEPAHNMRQPGHWHESRWDPQFIYWELVKACCLLHKYEVLDDIGIKNPRTGEVWTNPTLDELVDLVIGETGGTRPDAG